MRFENSDVETTVIRGAEELGIALPRGAGAAFSLYYSFLVQRGRYMNLTAISGEEDVARSHFLDSIALLKTHDFKGMRVIDIGSGAGFPGVPLKIADPSIDLTLLDSTGKRVKFLSELCSNLDIKAYCIHARAEESAHSNNMRENYDIVLSRAVARLNVLCELCLPFARVGGVFIAMKGVDSACETTEASNAIKALGARLQDCVDYKVPETDIVHRAVIISKTSQTPENYPRRFARIQKKPL